MNTMAPKTNMMIASGEAARRKPSNKSRTLRRGDGWRDGGMGSIIGASHLVVKSVLAAGVLKDWNYAGNSQL